MGLDIFLGVSQDVPAKICGKRVLLNAGNRMSSYGYFGSFRHAVCVLLEDKMWGSRYPSLMNHSDCDGYYTPHQSKKLAKEMEDIQREFKRKKCAVGEFLLNNKVISKVYTFDCYSDVNPILWNLEHKQRRFCPQIDGEGIKIFDFEQKKLIGPFRKVVSDCAKITATKINNNKEELEIMYDKLFEDEDSEFKKSHLGIKKEVRLKFVNPYKLFKWPIELLLALARNSVKYKARIIYC